MVVRLKYDEKPQDPRLTVRQSIDYRYSQSDVVWMSMDEWVGDSIDIDDDPDIVPGEIRKFIPKWREEAINIENTATNSDFWPVKHAASIVYYKGKRYRIDVGILSGIGNRYVIDWLFEKISSSIEDDMYSIGADYVRYMGMMD